MWSIAEDGCGKVASRKFLQSAWQSETALAKESHRHSHAPMHQLERYLAWPECSEFRRHSIRRAEREAFKPLELPAISFSSLHPCLKHCPLPALAWQTACHCPWHWPACMVMISLYSLCQSFCRHQYVRTLTEACCVKGLNTEDVAKQTRRGSSLRWGTRRSPKCVWGLSCPQNLTLRTPGGRAGARHRRLPLHPGILLYVCQTASKNIFSDC